MNTHTLQASGELNLKGQSWIPNAPKAIALLVHGFGEHMNRYQHVADFFNKKGIGLVAYDRRGHGTSDGQRGHFRNLETELSDITLHFDKITKEHPNTPIFLYGHSQGGNLSLNYMLRKKPNVKGAIITSPWLELAEEPPKLLIAIGKFLNNILPKVSTKGKVNPLSRDPEVDKKYYADPLVHGSITFRAANETINAGQWLLEQKGKIDAPMLLMHGSGDKVTSFAHSQQFYENTQKSIDVKWWEGFYHELHNEPEQKEVLEHMTNWMEARL